MIHGAEIEPLFDWEEAKPAKKVTPQLPYVEVAQTCSYCGQVSRNAYLHSTNHGLLPNGVCVRSYFKLGAAVL